MRRVASRRQLERRSRARLNYRGVDDSRANYRAKNRYAAPPRRHARTAIFSRQPSLRGQIGLEKTEGRRFECTEYQRPLVVDSPRNTVFFSLFLRTVSYVLNGDTVNRHEVGVPARVTRAEQTRIARVFSIPALSKTPEHSRFLVISRRKTQSYPR